MKKRVAIINSVYSKGSTGRICNDLSDFLMHNNFECITFYGRDNVNKPNSVYFGSKIDNYHHFLNTRLFGGHGLYSTRKTKKLLKLLDDFNADLFILNNLHGYYLNYKLLLDYISKTDKPVVLVAHDCWPFTGHCAHFSYINCNQWKSKCHRCKLIKSYPKSLLWDNVSHNFIQKKHSFNSIKNMYIVCPSKWMSSLVSKSFLQSKQSFVINNGIDISKFQKKPGLFKEKYNVDGYHLILSVAFVFNKMKGIDDVIKLASIIPENYRIVIVGKTHVSINFPDNIIHLNQTEDIDELIDIYSSCDVLFNPTYEDTFSNVNMEALCCGLPVVCYRTGGAYEMVDQDFVVDQGDLKKSLELIKAIVEKKINYNFRDRVLFSKDETYRKYLELINTLL